MLVWGAGQSWVYFASLLHAAAGAKQDASGSVRR